MNRFARLVMVLLVSVIAAALVTFAATPPPTAPQSGASSTNPDPAAGKHVVRVYYFYTTQRCASCRKIEALSAEAIRASFERELGDGSLEWEAVNTDDPPNQHFIEDYKLYTKSLVVVDVASGKQMRWKNLPKIWELLRDETAFRQYVESEVRAYLEKRS